MCKRQNDVKEYLIFAESCSLSQLGGYVRDKRHIIVIMRQSRQILSRWDMLAQKYNLQVRKSSWLEYWVNMEANTKIRCSCSCPQAYGLFPFCGDMEHRLTTNIFSSSQQT